MRILWTVVAATALLTGCGSVGEPEPASGGSTQSPAGASRSMPTAIPAAAGVVSTRYAVTVMDTGTGPELCLGGVADSYPPQCGGPPITNWDWADHGGGFTTVGETRWGEFVLTGRFDGTSFTVTDDAAPDPASLPDPDLPDFATPCPEPAGGWRVLDPAKATQASMESVFAQAGRLPGYANAWMDQSRNPADGEKEPEAMNDPALVTVNVQVTGDPADAERALRKIWGGALCVTRAKHTEAELQAIQSRLDELPGMLTSSSGRDRVEAMVVHDDGTLQAWADATYGEGLVRISSALAPATG